MRKFSSWFALLAGLSVALGAMGAHTLKKSMSTDMLETFKTGVHYLGFHALGGLILSSLLTKPIVLWMQLLGMTLFSGSLFAYTLSATYLSESWHFMVYVTPLGGVCWIISWVLAFIQLYKK